MLWRSSPRPSLTVQNGGLLLLLAQSLCGAVTRAEVVKTSFGRTAAGEPVEAYTLTNSAGSSVKLLTFGAAIAQISMPDRTGKLANVVLSLPDVAAWEANAHVNTVIGRFANRVRGPVTLDGKAYTLPARDNGVTLHGGTNGFNRRLWTASIPVGQTNAVHMTLVSPDGDQGLPGRLALSVTYSLSEANELRLDYEATTTATTLVNPTNHTYFNLGGPGAGSIYDHRLQILADRFTPTDQDQIPTGERVSVAGTPFDFRSPRPIGESVRQSEPQLMIGRGYDHNYALRGSDGKTLNLAARLHDPASGRTVEILTTAPGLQLYSGNHLNGTMIDAAGFTVRQGDAVALETQGFPNSPNISSFPSAILRPGETFRSVTVFRFLRDAPVAH